MKKYLASAILAIIAAGLFIALMGSDDPVLLRAGFLRVAPWLAFFYVVVSIGLKGYKSGAAINSYIGSIAIVCFNAACVVLTLTLPHFSISIHLGGQILFALAAIDIAVSFFGPKHWSAARNSVAANGDG
jgi:hypothetical protein